MGVVGMGAVEMLIVMLFYSGVGLPLGVPPGEPDPLMSRVAPEKCLYYTSWAGMDKPNPDANPTEALMAEAEVQELVSQVDGALEVILMDALGDDDEAKLVAKAGPLWIKSIISRPAAIYVTKFQIERDVAPQIEGGAIINTGDNTAKIRDSLLKLQGSAVEEIGLKVKEVEIGGATFYQFKPEPDAPLITWGTRGNYVLLGLGEKSIENMFANARTGPPAWLTDLEKKLPIERRSTITYGDIRSMIETGLATMEGPDGEAARRIVAALGLNNVKSYGAVTGLDKDGFVNRTVVSLEGEARGIFALADAKPLTVEDVAAMPADSTIAFSLRLDGQKVFDLVQEFVREADPQMAEDFDEGLAMINQMIGVDLREELLAGLGDTWCMYNSASEGGLLLTGVTATVDIRDKAKTEKVYKQLMALAKASLQPSPDDDNIYYDLPELKSFEFRGHTINYMTGLDDMPFAPSWCLTETHLVVALFPQSIQSMLARGDDFQSIAAQPDVAKTLADGPLSVTYVDTKTLFEMLYPLGKIFAAGALNNLAEETGAKLDVSILPQAKTISRHLHPSIMTIHRTDDGIEFGTRQSLPGSSVGSSAPVAVALLLPAIQAAREAARRAQSMNNLRQIGIACHNYHDTFGRMPSSTKTEDGKPGLSWRVHILPYVEGKDLYDQFHLDEPWDSEHNRKLIDKIPTYYQSPGARAQPGFTNYLGVAGEDGIFASREKGVRFAEVRDGLSNTAMVVEVDDKAAVPWTKPEDFDPADGMKPNANLGGIWSAKIFLAAFGDGSVQSIHRDVDPKVLKAIFTKSGGEVVGWDDWSRPARREGAAPDAFDDLPDDIGVEEAVELEVAP